MTIVKKHFKIKGMVCNSCEKIISKQALKLSGVQSIIADYETGKACVEYDSEKIDFADVKKLIEEGGYTCREEGSKDSHGLGWLAWVAVGFGIILIGYFGLTLYTNVQLPAISANASYGLLFLVGLLTGFHCVAMCGGFVVSYTAKGVASGQKSHELHASYAIGKTLSYTIIGAAFGLLGSIIAFTPQIRGWAGIISGIFLLLFGIKMLDLIPALRKMQFKLPKSVDKLVGEEYKSNAKSPFVIGLLNGLMIACGPLQAMYVLAAGTGSMIEGAKILFIFGLGTLPVMLGFGYLTSFISGKATHKILKASGVLIILLGLIMVNRGLALTGTGFDAGTLLDTLTTAGGGPAYGTSDGASTGSGNGPSIVLKDGYQEIRMTVDNSGFTPNKFLLKKGVPVKWIIDGKQLNGCNNAITVPKLGLNFDVKQGEQTIEFTPSESGNIPWSCWMGMLRGTFVVQDDVNSPQATQAIAQVNVPKGSTCGGASGGGGCGCGG